MIKTIFLIRFRQFYRLMSQVGTYRLILMLLVFGVLAFIGYNALILNDSTIPALIVYAVVLIAIHASRKDKHFLRLYGNKVYFIYLFEYLILTSPFLIIWLISYNWIGCAVLLLFCFIVPTLYLNLGTENSSSFIQALLHPFSSNLNFKLNIKLPFLPANAFEWKSGIRRNFPVISPIYLLVLAFSYKPYVAAAGTVFLSILFSAFYLYGESRQLIELFASNSKEFILKKIGLSVACFLCLLSPIFLIGLVFQPQLWYLLIAAIFISMLIQLIAVIFKYGLFAENSDLSRNGLIVSLNILFILIPFLWPAPLIMGVRYYLKAQKNLKIYFND